MNYFICDIVNTYTGSVENRKEEIEKLVSNLEKLIEVEKLDSLIFCFESTDAMDFVKEYIDEFSKYINGTKIKMGFQFCCDSYYMNGEIKPCAMAGKMAQTAFMLKDKDVNNIYFADDGLMNQDMMENLLLMKLQKDYKDSHDNDIKGFKPYNKLVQFIPGSEFDMDNKIGINEKGIDALNKIIESYIKRLELKRKI